ARMKGMAFAEPPQGEPAATQCAVNLHGFERVIGARRIEAARASEPGTQRPLVQADQEPGDEPHCSFTLRHSSSIPARSSGFAAPRARARALTTMSTAGSSC